MKRSCRGAAIAALLGAACGCSAPALDAEGTLERSEGIVNGSVDNGDPAVVFLWLGGGTCSGTLISPKVVLTAQHCVAGVGSGQVEAFFGTSADGQGTWIPATNLDAHPFGDIAAVTLAQPGPAQPIPLSTHAWGNGDEGTPVRIVGFGVTSEYGSDSGLKRQGMSQVVTWDSEFLYLGNGASDTCYGDSGGPAFIDVGGVEHVAGVTSFGTAECGYGMSGETRVDVFHDWVTGYIDAEDPPSCGPDAACAKGCPAVDPDCPCASDGFCTSACGDVASDVDCAGCAADGTCREDCPSPDTDCCAADGDCHEGCGASDPDCGGSEEDPGGGDDGGSTWPGDDEGGLGGFDDDDRHTPKSGGVGRPSALEGTVCSVGRPRNTGSSHAWLCAVGVLIAWRRRRSRR